MAADNEKEDKDDGEHHAGSEVVGSVDRRPSGLNLCCETLVTGILLACALQNASHIQNPNLDFYVYYSIGIRESDGGSLIVACGLHKPR
jgi:hypothetical protein